MGFLKEFSHGLPAFKTFTLGYPGVPGFKEGPPVHDDFFFIKGDRQNIFADGRLDDYVLASVGFVRPLPQA